MQCAMHCTAGSVQASTQAPQHAYLWRQCVLRAACEVQRVQVR